MSLVKIKRVSNINISRIENIILDWKINNMVTYINNIKYIDDKIILFDVEILNIIYNFSLNIYSNFIIKLEDDYDENNDIHLKIKDMLNKMNSVNLIINIDNIHLLLDKIEYIIDNYEFFDSDENIKDNMEDNIKKDNMIDNMKDNNNEILDLIDIESIFSSSDIDDFVD